MLPFIFVQIKINIFFIRHNLKPCPVKNFSTAVEQDQRKALPAGWNGVLQDQMNWTQLITHNCFHVIIQWTHLLGINLLQTNAW